MKSFDLAVIGGGPAGLTAAVYARRAEKSVVVLEKETFGGQITFSPKVENIPGFLSPSGNEFAEHLVDQALAQGAEMEVCEVTAVTPEEGGFLIQTDDEPVRARAVILATGARHRTLGLPGEEDLIGDGVSFCAVCDGAFYRGARVAVIGGGNSALQEALLLSDLAEKVIVVQNLDFLTGEKALQDQLLAKPNVEVILGTVLDAYLVDGELKGIRVRREKDGALREIPVEGVFLAVGLLPQNEPFRELVELDERGYAASGETCRTKTPGVFVAGDCRAKRIRQVTTAAADGAVAALAACDFLEGR